MYVCCRKNVVSSCSSNQVRIEVVYSFVNSMQFSGNQYTHNQPTRIPYEVPDTPRCVSPCSLCHTDTALAGCRFPTVSHGETGWDAAGLGGDIPNFGFFCSHPQACPQCYKFLCFFQS